MDVLMKAMVDDRLSHDGPIWQIPEVEIVPKPITKPHPPVSVAASSIESNANAGTRGIGVITFENYFGFEYLQQCNDAYEDAFQAADHSNVVAPNHYKGLYVATAYCAASREEARATARFSDSIMPRVDMPIAPGIRSIRSAISWSLLA